MDRELQECLDAALAKCHTIEEALKVGGAILWLDSFISMLMAEPGPKRVSWLRRKLPRTPH